MARGSGLGGLLAILGLALVLSKPRKLTASSFDAGLSPTYSQYFSYVTTPREELTDREALEESVTTSGQKGQWLTINGRIPTPRGTTIPLPTIHVGRTAVEEMLQPLEKKDPQVFEDVGGHRSVNLRLRRLDE